MLRVFTNPIFFFKMLGYMFCFGNLVFDSALAICISLLQKFISRLGIID